MFSGCAVFIFPVCQDNYWSYLSNDIKVIVSEDMGSCFSKGILSQDIWGFLFHWHCDWKE